jgi:RNA polymerase sigma-70 factor (ECF subfamily)
LAIRRRAASQRAAAVFFRGFPAIRRRGRSVLIVALGMTAFVSRAALLCSPADSLLATAGGDWYGTPMPGEGPASAVNGAEPADDARLMALVVRGDRGALAALYDRHAPVMLALGTRILADRTLAEDVVHDVFLEAWHHAREFDAGRGTVRAWLVTRMRSRALDRRGKVQRTARVAESAARESQPSASPEGIVGADRERVRRGVAGLPDELATIVDCAYFEGLSASEIAERLGLPIGTVKSRLARAIATLRAQIRPEREAPG